MVSFTPAFAILADAVVKARHLRVLRHHICSCHKVVMACSTRQQG